jgi:hypothetical protein
VNPDNDVLQIVRGAPTEDEVAAITAVVTTLTKESDNASTAPLITSRWTDRASLLRQPLRRGPGQWQHWR